MLALGYQDVFFCIFSLARSPTDFRHGPYALGPLPINKLEREGRKSNPYTSLHACKKARHFYGRILFLKVGHAYKKIVLHGRELQPDCDCT